MSTSNGVPASAGLGLRLELLPLNHRISSAFGVVNSLKMKKLLANR